MTQASLFDNPEVGRARRADPDTAKAAARTVSVSDLESKVLETLRRFGGMTTHELAEYLDLSLVSISPRMAPLRSKRFVVDSGERRKGPSGVRSIVWTIC
jgi:hypothetical protein